MRRTNSDLVIQHDLRKVHTKHEGEAQERDNRPEEQRQSPLDNEGYQMEITHESKSMDKPQRPSEPQNSYYAHDTEVWYSLIAHTKLETKDQHLRKN